MTNYRVGLVVLAVLGLIDVLSAAAVGSDDAPPLAVILIGLVLGLLTLTATPLAWREGPRRDRAFQTVAATRVLSALLAFGAFFDSGAPGWTHYAATAFAIVTVAGLGLCLAGRRQLVTA